MPPFRICSHPWEYHAHPFKIGGNLYYVGNTDVSSHLIATDGGLILLDTGFPQTLYLLLESIRRLGFDPAEIKYILHSHGHYDHFGGTRALVQLTGAQTALGVGDLRVLTTKPELSWAPEYGVMFYETFEIDTPLVDGQTISLGSTSIDCVSTPGHTPGTISYFFSVGVDGETYTAGIHGGPGLNTLTTEYLKKHGLPESYRLDFLHSLERLQERSVDIFIGAHPDQNDTFRKQTLLGKKANPFIDPTAWPKFLGKLKNQAMVAFDLDPF